MYTSWAKQESPQSPAPRGAGCLAAGSTNICGEPFSRRSTRFRHFAPWCYSLISPLPRFKRYAYTLAQLSRFGSVLLILIMVQGPFHLPTPRIDLHSGIKFSNFNMLQALGETDRPTYLPIAPLCQARLEEKYPLCPEVSPQ